MKHFIRWYASRQAKSAIRCGFGIGAFVMLLLIIGTIGGLERGYTTFKAAAIMLIIDHIALIVSVYLAGGLSDGRSE